MEDGVSDLVRWTPAGEWSFGVVGIHEVEPCDSVKSELRYPIILGDKISVGVARPSCIGQSVPCDR